MAIAWARAFPAGKRRGSASHFRETFCLKSGKPVANRLFLNVVEIGVNTS
jgi:hypothetical protein